MQFDKIIIEPHYFPCLEYFQALINSEEVEIEICQNFEKQNYNNRCYILSANGVLPLNIPLHKSSKIPYKDIGIDYSQKWTDKHVRAIQSAYGKSPYFEHYHEEILKVLDKRHTYLAELNRDILSICLEIMGIKIKLSYTSRYEKDYSEGVTDLRSVIHPKKTSILNHLFPSITYTQVFGSKFVKNLSIIDLLFCEGPNAGYKLSGKTD